MNNNYYDGKIKLESRYVDSKEEAEQILDDHQRKLDADGFNATVTMRYTDHSKDERPYGHDFKHNPPCEFFAVPKKN